MVEAKDIENFEDIQQEAASLAIDFVNSLDAFFKESGEDEIKQCPVCGGDFDLIEIGVEQKTLTDFWEKYKGEENYKSLAEKMLIGILRLILKVQPKGVTHVEIEEKLKELEPAVRALREVCRIMTNFKRATQRSIDEAAHKQIALNTLIQVDKALASAYPQQ